jgi:hypothetical protein
MSWLAKDILYGLGVVAVALTLAYMLVYGYSTP